MTLTPTLLLILDGWGLAKAGAGNAPSLAHTPHMDTLFKTCPHSQLDASGLAVGLPEGYIGNSEVGHLNIGAGSVVYQDMTRIDLALANNELASNAAYTQLIKDVKAEKSGRLHLAGLLSDGGVHSHINHLIALAQIAADAGLEVFVHCFMDGRDTSPHSGIEYVKTLENALESTNGRARIASLCGRFYAMDRDTRWERVEQAWNLLVHGEGERETSALKAMEKTYAADITDEFVKPTRIIENSHLQDGDGLFLFNFRADRMRELVQALTLEDFTGFTRNNVPRLHMASMTAYDASFTLPVAFPKDSLREGLGEIVASLGLKQLRIAETEKYAHVTYFFNGGREEPFASEDRKLIPSVRTVPTYDLAPAMSCHEITKGCIEAIESQAYGLIVCNLANGDMVGHTGILEAAITACEHVDACVGKLVEAVRKNHGRMLIISDHGNCETMLDAEGQPQTAHTTNPVPCILVQDGECKNLAHGKLADVAPTILGLWGVAIPETMLGTNLAADC